MKVLLTLTFLSQLLAWPGAVLQADDPAAEQVETPRIEGQFLEVNKLYPQFRVLPADLGTLVMDPDLTVEQPSPYSLGVAVADLQDGILEHFNLEGDHGVIVNEVLPETPAAAAGIQVHDILLMVGETALADVQTLQRLVGESEGQPIIVTWLHKGQQQSKEIIPAKREPAGIDLNARISDLSEFIVWGVNPHVAHGVMLQPEAPNLQPALDDLKTRLEALDQRLDAIQKLLEAQGSTAKSE